MTISLTRLAGKLRGLPVRWSTVALFALALTYADGFWVTVIQATIGAIERNEPPFTRWLRDSTLMLPVVALAVLSALLLARHWMRGRRALARLGGTLLLVAVIAGGVSIAEIAASSAYDYSFQAKHLELLHSYGADQQNTLAGFGPAAAPLPYTLYCNLRGVAADSAIALLQYATFLAHLRALAYASLLVLATNFVIVSASLALRKDRQWTLQTGAQPLAKEAIEQATAPGVLI
jgi:hypothetical protein